MSEQKENIVGMRKKLDAHVDHVRKLERRIHDLRARLAKYEDAEGRPKTAKWEYCPECGSEQIHQEEGDHKQCAGCYQEWFADMDYSGVVRAHLGGKYRDKDAVIERLNHEPAALKAPPSGVVMPPSPYLPGVDPAQLSDYERGEAQGRCDMWAEVARLNSSPVSAGESCDSCEPADVFATEGSDPFDFPDCGKKAAAQAPVKTAESHAALGFEGAAQVSSAPSQGGKAVEVVVKVWNAGGSGEFREFVGAQELPDGTKLYTHPADQVAEGVVVSRELLRFLLGESELHGVAFGDPKPPLGKFWWRTELRALLTKP